MSGMRETPPADLDQALIDLEADAPTPSAFEPVARWRRACGDAESAAEWQTWSLLPPEQADLRTALAECWRRLGRFDQAARLLNAQAPSWHQLAMSPQEQLLLVSSEHLFAHPEDELNRILAFLQRPTDNRDLLPHWRACRGCTTSIRRSQAICCNGSGTRWIGTAERVVQGSIKKESTATD